MLVFTRVELSPSLYIIEQKRGLSGNERNVSFEMGYEHARETRTGARPNRASISKCFRVMGTRLAGA